MPIHMTARFQVRPASREKCLTAIREFVDFIKANEPDTLLYTALQQSDDATQFLHYFIFKDEAAFDFGWGQSFHFDSVSRMY